MDKQEAAMQAEKVALIKRMVVLLEEIAFRTTAGCLEKEQYLEKLYAGSKR